MTGLTMLAAVPLLCFGATTSAEPVRSLLETRHEKVVIQQWDVSCGAAALATVLTYSLGDPISEREAARSMLRRTDPLRVKVRGGFSLLDLKRLAESRGHMAEGFRNLSLEELARLRSPIVPIEEFGDAHFVVVREIKDGSVSLADPAFGNRSVPLERFQRAWRDGIGFVVTRGGR